MIKLLWKVIKIIFWIIVSLLGLAILLSVFFANYRPPLKIENYFVQGAEFARIDFNTFNPPPKFNPNADPQITGPSYPHHNHLIQKGNGVLFGWSEFDSGYFNVTDDEYLKKLTIWFDSIPSGEINFGNRTLVIGYYSEGSPVWQKNQCGGEILEGSISVIAQNADEIKLNIKGLLECKGNRLKSPNPIRIDQTIDFLKKVLSDIGS